MVLSGPQVAKRAFIKLILALAASYTVSVLLTRESTDSQVVSAPWPVVFAVSFSRTDPV